MGWRAGGWVRAWVAGGWAGGAGGVRTAVQARARAAFWVPSCCRLRHAAVLFRGPQAGTPYMHKVALSPRTKQPWGGSSPSCRHPTQLPPPNCPTSHPAPTPNPPQPIASPRFQPAAPTNQAASPVEHLKEVVAVACHLLRKPGGVGPVLELEHAQLCRQGQRVRVGGRGGSAGRGGQGKGGRGGPWLRTALPHLAEVPSIVGPAAARQAIACGPVRNPSRAPLHPPARTPLTSPVQTWGPKEQLRQTLALPRPAAAGTPDSSLFHKTWKDAPSLGEQEMLKKHTHPHRPRPPARRCSACTPRRRRPPRSAPVGTRRCS